jgi:hypothetical protein
MMILMATVRALKIPYVITILTGGMIKSRTAISFENRVKIRPTGFESKNSILAFKILSHIAKCIFEVVYSIIKKIVDSLTMFEKPIAIRIPNCTHT